MNLFSKRRIYQNDLKDELASHLAEKAEALMAQGMSPEEAAGRARREFGNVMLTEELSREEWSWGFESVWADARYALRSLRKNPAFALTAIFTLALGIGANAAIFNLLHAVLLRTLPVPQAEQLRLVSESRDQPADEAIFSYPLLSQMQQSLNGRAEIAGFSSIVRMRRQSSENRNDQVDTQLVSGNFFNVLGAKAQIGRLLTSADDHSAGTFPAVLSDAYWSQNFARDPNVVGRQLTLNGAPVSIVGVAPRRFFGMTPGSSPAFWLPLSAQFDVSYRRNVWDSNGDINKPFISQNQIRWLSLVLRLPDSANEPQVGAILQQLYHNDMQREVKEGGWKDPSEIRALVHAKITLQPGDKGMKDLRAQFTEPLTVLMFAAGMVLLIASVNLASLALARIVGRRKEMAVRCSIGATRGRIVSQLLTEVLLLALIGGCLAIPVAVGSSHLLVRWASNGDPIPLELGLDGSVLVFILVASLISGLIFGLLPALEGINFPLAEAMKAQSTAAKSMRLPWGRTLIAIQVAFSFVLLTGAVLFVRTFMNYANMQLGFNPEHVISMSVDPLGAHYPAAQLPSINRRVLDAVDSVPGVQSASFANCGLASHCHSTTGIEIEGHPGENQDIQENQVDSEFFETAGVHLLSGRFFTRHDTASSPLLAVINATAAKKYFPGQDAIGKHFKDGDKPTEIIGVVQDAHMTDVHEEIRPYAFLSLQQIPDTYSRSLEVRVAGDPQAIESSIRAAINQAIPGFPVMSVRSVTELVSGNLLRERLIARLASTFAVLALGLACLGLFGVLSYAISRRTSEIGIRLALGAEKSAVLWMVLSEALWVIAIGLLFGVPVALGITRLVKGLLFGLTASDPVSMVAGAATLLLVGAFAALLPAWRASKVDPLTALRYE